MPGEIAFFQIKPHVASVTEATTAGQLLIRDGVPVLDRTRPAETSPGHRIEFAAGASQAAHAAIDAMEPMSQYKWQVADGMNVLAGLKPRNGTRPLYGEVWSSWRDPAFEDALLVVDEALAQEFVWDDFKPFFRLQSAYMLLWTSIERYASLRYGLGENQSVMSRVKKIATEPALMAGLRQIDPEVLRDLRSVARTDRPSEKAALDLEAEPEKAVTYFYQVRSNVTHRGKEEPLDWRLLHGATGSFFAPAGK